MLKSKIYIILALLVILVRGQGQPLNINLNNWTSMRQVEWNGVLKWRSSKKPFTGILLQEISKLKGDSTTTYVYTQYKNGKKNGWEVYARTGYLGIKKSIFIKYDEGEKVDTTFYLYYDSGDIKKMEVFSPDYGIFPKSSYEFYNRIPSDSSPRFNQVKSYHYHKDTIVTSYGEHGNVKSETFYEGGNSVTEHFDEAGRRTEIEKSLFTQDRLRWQKNYYPNGDLQEHCVGAGYTKQCTYYQKDGSLLKKPDTIDIKFSSSATKPIQFKTISGVRLINSYEEWRFNILLENINGDHFQNLIAEQSFAITLDDSISSWFLSFTQGEDNTFFLLYINDSTYVEFTERCCLGRNTVLAVSFNDVDKDGKDDISYIYEYITGVGSIEARNKIHNVGAVSLNRNNSFHDFYVEDEENLSMKQLFEEVRLKLKESK